MKTLRRLGLSALALIAAAGIAFGAADLNLSTGTSFLPGPRLIDGADLNIMLGSVNNLRDQLDGTRGITPTCTVTAATPATCNGVRGKVTTTALTTVALATTAYTITDSSVTLNSVVTCNINAYSGAGTPIINICTPGAGSIIASIYNAHATVALNAAMTIGFTVSN